MASPSQGLRHPNLSDSGYASLANSPDGKSSINRGVCQEPLIPSKPNTASILGGLKWFERDVDQATHDRFNDVVELVQIPLIQYMRKKYKTREFQPMAFRLMVIGETYDDAKPHVVILCAEDKTKRVKKFLAQRSITSICRPNDPSQIPFEVTVIGQPPRPKNGDSIIEVYGESKVFTLVGCAAASTLIRVTGVDGDRYATMGGIIKIVKADDSFVLCGLTAGHILEEADDTDDHGEISLPEELPYCVEESSDEESDSDEEMLHADTAAHGSSVLQNAPPPAKGNFGTSWSRLGTIAVEERPKEARNRDWALVEVINKIFQQTNTIQNQRDPVARGPARQLILAKEKPIRQGPRRRVLVATSGNSCLKKGFLSNLPTMALLPSGTKFVPVYTIALDDESVLPNGSSGSWVIDESSCEVYGHVVADDPFGDIFVVPFADILDDIKHAVGAKEVTLPSDIDVLSYLSQNTSEAFQRSSSPTSLAQFQSSTRSFIESSLEQTPPGSPSATPITPKLGSSSRAPAGGRSDRAPAPRSPTLATGGGYLWGLPTPDTSPPGPFHNRNISKPSSTLRAVHSRPRRRTKSGRPEPE